jgi:hypothetical protein
MGVKEEIKERRLERMRQGQKVAEIVPLVSDPEIRVALVPLTEAEFVQVLQLVSKLQTMDTMAGMQWQSRVQSEEVLVRSLRDPNDLETRLFESVVEMTENLEASDIERLVDEYNGMTDKANPQIDGISADEFEQLKKVLQKMDWNALSGRSWYAAKRFLGALITEGQLMDSSLGSSLTKPLITTNE